MKQLYIPGLSVLATIALISLAWMNLDLPNQERVHACIGECYQDYVAANGNILDQQRAAAEAAASASPAELGQTAYAGCQACHGATGGGGVGHQVRQCGAGCGTGIHTRSLPETLPGDPADRVAVQRMPRQGL